MYSKSTYIYIINERNRNTEKTKEYVDILFYKVKSLLTSDIEIVRILMCDILNNISRDIGFKQFNELSELIIKNKEKYPLHQLTIIFWRFEELLKLLTVNIESLYQNEWGLSIVKRINSRYGSIENLKKRLEKNESWEIRKLKSRNQ